MTNLPLNGDDQSRTYFEGEKKHNNNIPLISVYNIQSILKKE